FLSKEYITLGTQMGVYEMLKTGTTCFLDMYFMPADTVAVTAPAGIRCFNGPAVIDFGDGSVDGLIDLARDYGREINIPTASGPRDGSARLIASVLASTSLNNISLSAPTSLVTPVICPHSCYTVPKEKIQKLADAVSSRGDDAPVLTHIHLHESTGEIASYYEKSGESAIETLKSVGLLNRNMIAAHCVHLTEDEISTLATAGVNAAHCPRSNLKLASGLSPVQRLLDAGINVCLGTDSACSNNSLCMLQEMQFASLVGKLSSGSDARSVNCHTALRMATMNGAKALGKDKDLGSLEVGKIADIVAVDLGHIGSLPVYDPVSALVYTNERTVSDVWIDGKRVVKSSQVLTMARPNVNQMEQFRRRLIKFKKEECGPRRHANRRDESLCAHEAYLNDKFQTVLTTALPRSDSEFGFITSTASVVCGGDTHRIVCGGYIRSTALGYYLEVPLLTVQQVLFSLHVLAAISWSAVIVVVRHAWCVYCEALLGVRVLPGPSRLPTSHGASYGCPRLDTPEAQLSGMGRVGVGPPAVCVVLIHSERLATAWRKQYKALSSEERDFSDVDFDGVSS
ncbi:hypothetical protein FOZ62_025253, partial [Perkinsus olseni]